MYSKLILWKLQDIFRDDGMNMVPQSFEECVGTARVFLDSYKNITSCQLSKNFYKILMFSLSMSIFSGIGINFDKLNYTKIEQAAMKKIYKSKGEFVYLVLDTITLICERGYQCMKSGSLDPLYHSGKEYDDWYLCVQELKRKSNLLSFPEAHGFTKFQYLSDLEAAREKGECIKKRSSHLTKIEKMAIFKVVDDLNKLRDDELTSRAAMKNRKAPFALLLHGGSSIGKSMLTEILYHVYGNFMELPTSEEYKYTRCFFDEYWSNFKTSMWCVVLDDVAFQKPSACADVDVSIKEIIQIVNNTPLVPPQAALEDKGRTPVQCKLVLASTNVEHMNTWFFFSTPVAVNRRFPFVVSIEVKQEHAKDEVMLDPNRIPELINGELPNLWNFTIKRVVPGIHQNDTQPKFEIVHTFDDIHQFIHWYCLAAKEHESNQAKAEKTQDHIRSLRVCKHCAQIIKFCECGTQPQSLVQYVNNATQDNRTNSTDNPIGCAVWLILLCNLIAFLTKPWVFIKQRLTRAFLRLIIYAAGRHLEHRFGRHKNLIHLSCTIAKYSVAIASLYMILKQILSIFFSDKENLSQQGNVQSVDCGKAPNPKGDEKENVWKKDNFVLSSFDLNSLTTSWKNREFTENLSLIARNLVHFTFKIQRGNVIRKHKSMGLCIGGHYYITTNHTIPDDENMELTITQQTHDIGVTPNITILLVQGQIKRNIKKDLAMIEILNVPPKKNLIGLFPKQHLSISHKCSYVKREENGMVDYLNVNNVQLIRNAFNETLQCMTDSYMGKTQQSTIAGDCGSVLISDTAKGPVILGIHHLGDTAAFLTSAIAICEQDLINLGYDVNKIVGSGKPSLEAQSAKRILGSLDHRANVRFHNTGVCEVYGSFKDFRVQHKSSVEMTPLYDTLKEKGFQCNYGRPVMSGYKPWHIANVDMLHPVTHFDSMILRDAIDAFKIDIFANISDIELSEEVFVYDTFTAINGAVGVAYVDSINRSTSAGNPWKVSKRKFLKSIPEQHGLQDPVEVDSEILRRSSEIIELYKKGERACPNFCAHLKDEPVSEKKRIMGKTRVFTGSPFDWNIVVRKYLLSVVRLIQNNKFVFECAPGTNCHSMQWTEIYTYITKFGTDRCIAGDYKAFDKSMPPSFILGAFEIIESICYKAGYSEDELKVIRGIAEDTAFPLVDMNGDLIQYYGSNPSGHPLTVIINSLVNSLYMRYAYHYCNPNKECKTFRRNVSLMTYGDDNIAGVSKDISFFDHTKVQLALASIGITYTMADKEAESIPFLCIEEVNFLKRKWKYDHEVGAYLCPLEEESIIKSMMVWTRSKTITPEEQIVAILSSAHQEYFFHGRKKFNEMYCIIQDMITEHNLQDWVQESHFPSWNALKKRFWENSE